MPLLNIAIKIKRKEGRDSLGSRKEAEAQRSQLRKLPSGAWDEGLQKDPPVNSHAGKVSRWDRPGARREQKLQPRTRLSSSRAALFSRRGLEKTHLPNSFHVPVWGLDLPQRGRSLARWLVPELHSAVTLMKPSDFCLFLQHYQKHILLLT